MNWFENFILKRIFNWACKRLDGYKSILGGVGMILSGAAFIINGLREGSYEQTIGGFALAAKGLEGIGQAGKAEKQITALKMIPEVEKRRLLQ